jgi:DNA-binding HxlR family transcriptional regulator
MKNPKRCPKIQGCLERSICPVTNTLDLIGDKWTLLVIRDMMFLKKRLFNEFLESFEGIATNILTDRLKRLEEYRIIEKRPYRKKPVRYEYKLTKHGEDLRPLLMEMIYWGHKHIEGAGMPPEKFLTRRLHLR